MDKHFYVNILETVMPPFAEYHMPLKWVFQHEDWLRNKSISVLGWPAQSTNCNPIEKLWSDIKKDVVASKPSKKENHWAVIKEFGARPG